jgi:hypothetical protein
VAERIAEVVVLVEDLNHKNFVHRYLKRLGRKIRNIRFAKAPPGRGAGEQWVRQHYSEEVRQYRQRSQHRRGALVVVIDADTNFVLDRRNELEEELTQAGLAQRSLEEAIALLIPKRHIETWILCLCGQAVDEEFDYKRSHDPQHDVTGKFKAAAETFFDWSRENVSPPGHCADSLRRGLREIRRIP